MFAVQPLRLFVRARAGRDRRTVSVADPALVVLKRETIEGRRNAQRVAYNLCHSERVCERRIPDPGPFATHQGDGGVVRNPYTLTRIRTSLDLVGGLRQFCF